MVLATSFRILRILTTVILHLVTGSIRAEGPYSELAPFGSPRCIAFETFGT
jgi:hypothetical protein